MFSITRAIGPTMFALCGLFASASDIHAADLGNGWGPNVQEIAQLPGYCQKFFRDKVMPPNCDGAHHLCAGKVLINRTFNFSIPKTERKRILNQAKGEVAYIFGRKNPSCALMDDARATETQIKMQEIALR